ncbi:MULTISPECIES: hypothetical protein [unclassified Streptomyces]|uniref:hypothetical protein n=1 Tax=unclassified Streptomyces TaxID=2593676 RepID=UPI0006C50E67|nr:MULTISPECIES: hypothetical protein [unclassified Streptomyces]KOX26303.1 hypothetical protein ADL06_16310 [Streptomyces sp. NRRL F-6491]KOX36864.1 hypothetical protein ADL08_31605 [Streptomyces sp. NRRL F-6492]
MAALTGCVSVDAPTVAPLPAPAAEPVRPGKDVAPQIVDGPAREALEAALPAPPPSAAPRATPTAERGRRAAAPPLPEAPRPGVVPRQRERPRASAGPDLFVPDPSGPAAPAGPAVPTGSLRPGGLPGDPPLSPSDVCALGERYGGWSPGGGRSGICPGS